MRQFFSSISKSKDDIIKALVQGKSDIAVVAETYASAAKSLASEGTKKVQSFTSLGGIVAGAAGISSVVRSVTGSLASVGRSAAENAGNTTVGDISISQDNIATISSNDVEGVAGAGGEAGVGGAAAGTSTPTITQSRDGENPVSFFFGDNPSNAFATDDAQAVAGSTSSLLLEPSANGALNVDSNIDQQPVVCLLYTSPSPRDS